MNSTSVHSVLGPHSYIQVRLGCQPVWTGLDVSLQRYKPVRSNGNPDLAKKLQGHLAASPWLGSYSVDVWPCDRSSSPAVAL
jgi:hypothetical protein